MNRLPSAARSRAAAWPARVARLLPVLLAASGLGGCATLGADAQPAARPAHRGLVSEVRDQEAIAQHDDIAHDLPVAGGRFFTDTAVLEPSERKLITSGDLRIAVGDSETALQQAKTLALELGGYVQSLRDDTITLRLPANRWDEALARAGELGRVVARSIQVQDVTEEFLDLEIQLQNARALRKRLEELMAKAEDVKSALEVERELARVRTEIERIEGRLKYLSHNVALSVLTLRFVAAESAPRPMRQLPFAWLSALGVEKLLGLGGRR